ncbi:ABC transporter ATP-binding protein [Paraburkholderia sp. LEh10]|nr:ABC transporter ATP-binding protein [Paraburkholderia sp. LEh10]
MMAIAGFTDVTSGEVYIEGRRVDMLPPHKRNIGVVFQHLALFPHLSVQDNLAFPLRMRGVKEAAIAAKVHSALELVHLSAFADRLPNQLSGGQQQRVALARAIIFDPPVLLLDEPLSALDRKLRESMQNELKNLQRKLGVTTVMVTHDQEEALAVSDRIAVMNNGEVVQLDTPEMLYEKPNSLFVADFIGHSTKLEGVVTSLTQTGCRVRTKGGMELSGQPTDAPVGSAVSVVIRPERFAFDAAARDDNHAFGQIVESTYAGDAVTYGIKTESSETLMVKLNNLKNTRHPVMGDRTQVSWKVTDTMVFATNR